MDAPHYSFVLWNLALLIYYTSKDKVLSIIFKNVKFKRKLIEVLTVSVLGIAVNYGLTYYYNNVHSRLGGDYRFGMRVDMPPIPLFIIGADLFITLCLLLDYLIKKKNIGFGSFTIELLTLIMLFFIARNMMSNYYVGRLWDSIFTKPTILTQNPTH
jgi:hypothetical protein